MVIIMCYFFLTTVCHTGLDRQLGFGLGVCLGLELRVVASYFVYLWNGLSNILVPLLSLLSSHHFILLPHFS